MIAAPAFLTAPAATYDAWLADVRAWLDGVEFRVVRQTRDARQFSVRAYERNGWEPSTEVVEWTVHAFVGDVDLTAEAAELVVSPTGEGCALHYCADDATTGTFTTRKAAARAADISAGRFAELLTSRWTYYETVDTVRDAGAVR